MAHTLASFSGDVAAKSRLSSSTRRRHRRTRAFGPALIGFCAIAVGVAVYAFLRPHPALFLPAGWHRPLAQDLSAAATAGLPTFVHGLAMPLLVAALMGVRRGTAAAAICAGWCVVEIAFEAAQHPAVGVPLLAALPAAFAGTGTFRSLASFIRGGTFDPLDIVAAVLATWAAYRILARAALAPAAPREAAHA